MRMLVLILLLINLAMAGLYLAGDRPDANQARRPAPGKGSLTLVAEARTASAGQSASVQCWRSPSLEPGNALTARIAELRRGGYHIEAEEVHAGGFTVEVARTETIQAAAERLQQLKADGMTGLQVRPAGEHGMLIVAGRFADRLDAEQRARTLRERGVDATVSSGAGGGVSLVVSAPPGAGAPGNAWRTVDCQAERP